jgi:hypothetical protein
VSEFMENHTPLFSWKCSTVALDPTEIHGRTIRILLPSVITDYTPTSIIRIKGDLDWRSLGSLDFLEGDIGVPRPFTDRISNFLSLSLVTAICTVEEFVFERLGTKIPKLVERSEYSVERTATLSDYLVDGLGSSRHEDVPTEFSSPFWNVETVIIDFGSWFRFGFDRSRGWGRRLRRPDIASADRLRCRNWDGTEGVSHAKLRLRSTWILGFEPSLGGIDNFFVSVGRTLLDREIDPITGLGIDIGEESERLVGGSSKDCDTDICSDESRGARKIDPSV